MNPFTNKLLKQSASSYSHEEIQDQDQKQNYPPCSVIDCKGQLFSELCETLDIPVIEYFSKYLVLFNQGGYGYLVNSEDNHNEVAFFEVASPYEISALIIYSSYKNFINHLNSIEVETSIEEDDKYYTIYLDTQIKGKKMLKYWEQNCSSEIKLHGFLALALTNQYPQLTIRNNKPTYCFKVEPAKFSKFSKNIQAISDKKLLEYQRLAKMAKRRDESLPEHIHIAVSQGFFPLENSMVEYCLQKS